MLPTPASRRLWSFGQAIRVLGPGGINVQIPASKVKSTGELFRDRAWERPGGGRAPALRDLGCGRGKGSLSPHRDPQKPQAHPPGHSLQEPAPCPWLFLTQGPASTQPTGGPLSAQSAQGGSGSRLGPHPDITLVISATDLTLGLPDSFVTACEGNNLGDTLSLAGKVVSR